MPVRIAVPQVNDAARTAAVLFGAPRESSPELTRRMLQYEWNVSSTSKVLVRSPSESSAPSQRVVTPQDSGGWALAEGRPAAAEAHEYLRENDLEGELALVLRLCQERLGAHRVSLELKVRPRHTGPPFVKVIVNCRLPLEKALDQEAEIVRECLRTWTPEESSRLMVLVR